MSAIDRANERFEAFLYWSCPVTIPALYAFALWVVFVR